MFLCFVQRFQKNNVKNKEQEEVRQSEKLLKEIDKARREWDIAIQHFQDAYHPDMVEYMVYYINAAEKKYMYLLNQYKERKERLRASRNY